MENNQLHAVSRTQLGNQREPIVKTLRSPLSAESGGIGLTMENNYIFLF